MGVTVSLELVRSATLKLAMRGVVDTNGSLFIPATAVYVLHRNSMAALAASVSTTAVNDLL